MNSKDLVKKMSISELRHYCEAHPKYHIPNANEAELLETEHGEFWIDETLGDRCVVYDKQKHVYRRVHPAFFMRCVVVRW